jgi:hypothetical protein
MASADPVQQRRFPLGTAIARTARQTGARMSAVIVLSLVGFAAEPVVLDHPTVPATGRGTAIATVDTYGRYAFLTRSAQGTAIQLVDKMAGPGAQDGAPGVRDGRIDVFLDRGTYQLVATSDPAGTGDAKLEAHGFAEQNADPPPLLVELHPIETALADLQRRSWWVKVDAPGTVAIEAAGRSLADLRLWQDGSWLVADQPACAPIEPTKGQPLRDCTLTAALAPGLYLVVAYGGPEQIWAETSSAQPLYVRSGMPRLPEAGREQLVVSPFGLDRYIVGGHADHFRLELPEATPAALGVRAWDPSAPFRTDGRAAKITDESRLPVAELDGVGRETLVSVSGTAGQSYILQHFVSFGGWVAIPPGHEYFLATLHAGDPVDSVDATGIIVDSLAGTRVPTATSTVPIASDHAYQRRFNLLDETSLFLDVREHGTYKFTTTGTVGRIRVEPFLTSKPQGYKTPAWTSGSLQLELDAGFYVVTLAPEPEKAGITELSIGPAGFGQGALGALGLSATPKPGPILPNLQSSNLSLPTGRSYAVYMNQQPGVAHGIVLRSLPVDLEDALPVTVLPGQTVAVRTHATRSGTLTAVGVDGLAAEVAVDGGGWTRSADVATGDHAVQVRNTGDATVQVSLAVVPTERKKETPLPPVPPADLATLPKFAEITAADAQYFDLANGIARSFLLKVETPAMYRVESTGLLSTSATLRTRTVPSFAAANANGTGRNFVLGQYLREGDYQVTVGANSPSAGHLGVQLWADPVRDGGVLGDGVPARAALAAGEGVVYRFTVPEDGDYAIRSFGPGQTFRMRLEDADGWPLTTPGIDADLTWHFTKGTYRIYVLPEDHPTRRLTLVERAPEPVVRAGHGPHPLPLDIAVTHTWWEPQDAAAARTPDVWTFTLPADAEVAITATDEMAGTLFTGDRDLGRLVPGRPYVEALKAGSYRLELANARRNSGVAYTVTVAPTALLAGMSREIAAPAELPVAVGADGVVTLSSYGAVDVRARLLDARGDVVAESDDRPEDWNFLLQPRLAPGDYTLEVLPVGGAGTTRVTMDAPAEVAEGALAAGKPVDKVPGKAVHVWTIDPPSDGVLVASAASADAIGLALEASDGGPWRVVDSAIGHEIRVAARSGIKGRAWRVRLWSLDQRDNPAKLRFDAVNPSKVNEGSLATGAQVAVEDGPAPALTASSTGLDRAGTFALPRSGVTWTCATPGDACRPVAGTLVAGQDALWLLTDVPAGRRRAPVVATRAWLRTEAGGKGSAELRLPLDGPAALDLAPHAGPVVVLATGTAGQPGVAIASKKDARIPVDRAMAVADGAAAAAILDAGDAAAVVFPASDAPGAEVRVRAFAFPAVAAETAAYGLVEGKLNAGEARAITLPGGAARLALADGLVAVLSRAPPPVPSPLAAPRPHDPHNKKCRGLNIL